MIPTPSVFISSPRDDQWAKVWTNAQEEVIVLHFSRLLRYCSMSRPTLQALEVFIAVGRSGNFRRTAAERGVTPSALSHVTRRLEQSLGARLFHRTSRSVALTEAGHRLLEQIGPAVDGVGRALDAVKSSRNRAAGRLRLNVPRITTELVFEPIIGPFLRAYPDIRLEIVTTDGLVDIVAEGFDAGIRRDRRLASGMIAIPVGPARRFAVVGSPDYFRHIKKPSTPDDLADHRCIGRVFPNGSRYAWEFKKGKASREVEVSGPLVVDDTRLMLAAAVDGLGLAVVFEDLERSRVPSRNRPNSSKPTLSHTTDTC
jgi:DNA-binding transcriptional LysR family regulator